jgi:hypothetical protein
MEKKPKDGITELTKTLRVCAQKLNKREYDLVSSTCFALMNGIKFGYEALSSKFIQDKEAIYDLHSDKPAQTTNNVVQLKVVQGGKNATAKL